jgi:hypothetical protein
MFNAHANSGQLTIGAFLCGSQFASAWLFFGWRVWLTPGA